MSNSPDETPSGRDEHDDHDDDFGVGRDGDDVAAAPESAESRRIGELERELLATQEKLRQYSMAVDRARGEFEAARGRLEREQARVVESQKIAAVTGLLGVLDSLDQALHSAADGGIGFIQGVAMIRSQFDTALRELGLERFDSVGQTFDPERHNAIATIAVLDPAQNGVVLQEHQAGAQVHGKVVRPAIVVVGSYTAPGPAEA